MPELVKYNHQAKPVQYDTDPPECSVCGVATLGALHIDEAPAEKPAAAPIVPRARNSDPATSHQAAASVTGLRGTQIAVLDLFRQCGPMTDEHMVAKAEEVNIPQSVSGLRTRRSELATLGLLVDSGERRLTVSNRSSIVWRIDPQAIARVDAPRLL